MHERSLLVRSTSTSGAAGDERSNDARRGEVRWIASGGARREADIAEAASKTAQPDPQNDDPYTYRTLQHGTVGVIDFRRCEDLPRFKRFLDVTFQSIKAAPVRALVYRHPPRFVAPARRHVAIFDNS